jgi:cysteinyl-tRNA synthetase
MNFTWDALEAAQTALGKLRRHYLEAKEGEGNLPTDFDSAINEDLNMPKALSVVWESIESLSKSDFQKIDSVFGLEFSSFKETEVEIPSEVSTLLKKRESLRKEGKYEEADKARWEIEGKGFVIEDNPQGAMLKKKN